MNSVVKTQDLRGDTFFEDAMEIETKIWDVSGFIGYARFLCSRKKREEAISELLEAINLLKGLPLDGHIGSLLAEASDNLQEAIDCLEDGYISEAIRLIDTATAALKMVAKEIADTISKKIGGGLQ